MNWKKVLGDICDRVDVDHAEVVSHFYAGVGAAMIAAHFDGGYSLTVGIALALMSTMSRSSR